MRRTALVACAAAVAAAAAGLATSASTPGPAITATAIARAKLGLAPGAYKRLLGKPFRNARGTPGNPGQPDDWWRLVFSKRKLSVYFVDGVNTGVLITTWNKTYRTSQGVGPCSTIKRMKAAYGDRLTPSKFNTSDGVVYAWTLGKNLIFASNDRAVVETVGLYDGSDPNVLEPGGSLSWAGFITLSEVRCS